MSIIPSWRAISKLITTSQIHNWEITEHEEIVSAYALTLDIVCRVDITVG